MNKLPKEKRDKIIGIGVGALVLIGAIYYLIISAQKDALAKFQQDIGESRDKLNKAEKFSKRAGSVNEALADIQQNLSQLESQMIPSEQVDGNKWLFDLLTDFAKTNRFDVRLTAMSKNGLKGKQFLILPHFDYWAAEYIVECQARFRDFGRFLSLLENQYPFLNLQSLQMSPMALLSVSSGTSTDQPETGLIPADREKLNISMKVVLLYKPPGLR